MAEKTAQKSTRGGIKLRRANRHNASRRSQWGRTARNKRNRIEAALLLTKSDAESDRLRACMSKLRFSK